ncbi:MAG: glycosyltransferase [Pseudoxanthomonas sp.]
MLILTHTTSTRESIRNDLGRPEYSYYFVLRELRPVLEDLGVVVEVADPERDVDTLYRNCRRHGIPCIFLSFSPPHKTPINLECPTLPVFAWEFDTIPNEGFMGKPRNDWTRVLGKLGGAVTHSGFIVRQVRQLMGQQFPIVSAPAPVWDTVAALRDAGPAQPVAHDIVLRLEGMVIDSRDTDLSAYDKSSLLAAEGQPLPLPATRQQGSCEVVLDGVVYTSIFNPGDGRKNWQDMIQAFCIAFKEVADATLVLKLTHYDVSSLVPEMLEIMYKCGDLACRVVMLHGYLEQDAYERLLLATSYAVNTSMGEGQCLPLMEYMSAGKPAIAPRHSSMADYIDESCAFVLKSSLEPSTWPHDPRQAMRTLRHRLDFGSIVAAYRESHRVAKESPDRYLLLSQGAIGSLKAYCSRDVVRERLRQSITRHLAARDDRDAHARMQA